MDSGEIRIKNETLAVLDNYVLTRGVPLPPGAVINPDDVSVTRADGTVLPSAGSVLQRRPDGSIEWIALDILFDLGGQESTSIFVAPKPAPQPRVENGVTVADDGTVITLSNGLSEVAVSRDGGALFHRLIINGTSLLDDGMIPDLQVLDGGGKIYRASLSGQYGVTVTHQNTLRSTVTITGSHQARDGSTFLDFSLTLTLTAGCPDVTIGHTFYCHEAGDGRIAVKAIRLVLPTVMDGAATTLLRQLHHGHTWFPRSVEVAENVEIVASCNGDIDNYNKTDMPANASHPRAIGTVFIRNIESLHEDWNEYPFYMRPGQESGFRAELSIGGVRPVHPVIGWKDAAFTMVTTFEHFAQLHPKSIAIDENILTYSFWPEWSVPMQIVKGVSKSHTIRIAGENRQMSMEEVERYGYRWQYNYCEPIDVSFDPAWPIYCQVLDCHHAIPYQPDKYPMLESILEPVPLSSNETRHTYDRQPAYGMFHFGGELTDDACHCANNEDDLAVLFPLLHFLRTGQTYAWDYGRHAAWHYMEVDFCEWSDDLRQYGGLIAHTSQHFIGNVYPSHQWAEGILAFYYLSGDIRARNVVVRVGDNCCYWVENLLDSVTCDGREAGMPLVNLAAAFRLTGDEKYLVAARTIVDNFHRRWIHPDGTFKYPYPQGTTNYPHKLIAGYGDWSTFYGLYRLWDVTNDDSIKDVTIRLLDQSIQPGRFTVRDFRGMDFMAAWILGRLTGDMDGVIERVRRSIPMLLRKGGHPLRRLEFLAELDRRGLIDDRDVGHEPAATGALML